MHELIVWTEMVYAWALTQVGKWGGGGGRRENLTIISKDQKSPRLPPPFRRRPYNVSQFEDLYLSWSSVEPHKGSVLRGVVMQCRPGLSLEDTEEYFAASFHFP